MANINRENLVEIKKGNTGKGLLIESDGFVSLDLPENKMLRESIDDFKSGNAHELPTPFVVSAVFQKYGIENANGRIYPENVLKPAVEKLQEKVKMRTVSCELEHPDSSNINLERVCALVTELHWIGRTLLGKLEIPISEGFRRYGICSTLADTLAQWLISGIRIGVSSRALGGVEQVGSKLYVTPDLELITFDVVSTPSTNNAWIEFEEEKLTPYLQETVHCKENIIIENNQFTKFDEWLNNE